MRCWSPCGCCNDEDQDNSERIALISPGGGTDAIPDDAWLPPPVSINYSNLEVDTDNEVNPATDIADHSSTLLYTSSREGIVCDPIHERHFDLPLEQFLRDLLLDRHIDVLRAILPQNLISTGI